LYIYQRDIPIAFISDVFAPRKSPIFNGLNPNQFVVFTNAKVDKYGKHT